MPKVKAKSSKPKQTKNVSQPVANEKDSDNDSWFELFGYEEDSGKPPKKKDNIENNISKEPNKSKKVVKKTPKKKDKSIQKKNDVEQMNSDNDSWFELFGYEQDDSKEKISKDVSAKKSKEGRLSDNDTDSVNDSFEKYFPKEKGKPETKRAKKDIMDYSRIVNIEGYEVKSDIFCSICNSYFNTMPGHPQNNDDHILKVHAKAVDDGLYLCNHCDMTAPKTFKSFKHHFFVHRDMAKPKVCPGCDESFTNYNKWRCHKRSCNKLDAGPLGGKHCYTCEKCGKICRSKYSLDNHIINIHEKKGRKCRWCPRIVPYDEWEEHKEMEKIKHNVRTKTDCKICGKTFSSKDSAANHRRTYHRNVIVECHLCHKTFRSSQALSQHKTNNHLPKRFQCAYCQYRNAYRWEVVRHICKVHKLIKEELPKDAVIEHQVSEIPEMRESHFKKIRNNDSL